MPGGMHRDAVGYVLVLLIRRRNTRGAPPRSTTLTTAFDAALIHDARASITVSRSSSCSIRPCPPIATCWW